VQATHAYKKPVSIAIRKGESIIDCHKR
jgi:hypothetical protein